jgi:hypothetical protein
VSTVSSDRAYANQLTGSLHLLDLPANTLFKYVLKRRLPEPFLTSFLHEATHFWCEASPLGTALACLELRAHRDVRRHRLLRTIDRGRFLHDIAVVDATRLLLTPLLEGMALFQEFDAYPGASRVLTNPGLWVGMLFTPLNMEVPKHRSSKDAAKWWIERIFDAMARYRTSAAAVRRKTEILMQTLSGDPHYYLSGYLAVKQIWFNAARKTPAFLDRDLFLTFLHDWVFKDWILIGDVLDESQTPTSTARLVSKRLQERLGKLAATDLTKEAAQFERQVDSRKRSNRALIEALHLDIAAAKPAKSRLRELLAEVDEGVRRNDKLGSYFPDFAVFMHRTELMRLALEKVQIEVKGHGMLVRKGPEVKDIYMAGPAPAGASPGVTDGWIAVYFFPKQLAMLEITVRATQAMSWFPPEPDLAPDWLIPMPDVIAKVIATEAARRSLHVQCRELAQSYLDNDYIKVRETLPAHVAQLYKRFALCFVREGYVASVQEMLDDKGMYTLLERDGDLLTALAVISLRLAGLVSKEDAIPIFKEYEVDADRAFQRLEEIAQRTGAQIVLTSENGEIWCRT